MQNNRLQVPRELNVQVLKHMSMRFTSQGFRYRQGIVHQQHSSLHGVEQPGLGPWGQEVAKGAGGSASLLD